MRIGLQTWGSEGDVRPFIALAAGLRANNHEITLLITSPDEKDYSSYSKLFDINIVDASKSYKDLFTNFTATEELVKKTIFSKNPMTQLLSFFEVLFEPGVDELYEAAQKLCESNDLVIGHTIIHPLQLAAQKSKCHYITLILSPGTIATKFFPPNGLPNLGAWINKLLWKFTKFSVNLSVLKFPNALRKRENQALAKDFLSDVMLSKALNLIAVSPTLFQAPTDWDENIQVSGFLELPTVSEQWEMPIELQAFLIGQVPPVYLTFGSITAITRQRTLKLFVESVKLAGCRAIIQADWQAEDDIPKHPDIFTIDKVPHNQVFTYCALVVHHGGAGTSHSASRSGCPSIVIEHFADQNYNASMLKKSGLVNKILHFTSVTPASLAAEISTVLANPAMKQKAETIARSMQNENGVMKTVELVEHYISKQVKL